MLVHGSSDNKPKITWLQLAWFNNRKLVLTEVIYVIYVIYVPISDV
jgi:hypothetical protein